MAAAVDWARIKRSASGKALFFLNDYFGEFPRLRIEMQRGGARCLWKAKTTRNNMEATKRYLEKEWRILDKRSISD